MSLSAGIAAFAHKTGVKHSLVVKKAALEALTRVILRSPVDTGRFRGNWNVALENADLSTSKSVDKSGQETISRGTAFINAVEIKGGTTTIVISNNLPYAKPLEEGHSKQAPHGMVALTIQELTSYFNKIAKSA